MLKMEAILRIKGIKHGKSGKEMGRKNKGRCKYLNFDILCYNAV